ncbi:hypothetical protein WS68_05505 [Burkholderia sp. TSV86]|nr:hypothetical protein WS68_05505 [Burkholderia sp. TSV86]
MKYGAIKQMRQGYPAPPMYRVLSISVNGYCAWRKHKLSKSMQQEPRLEAEVLAAHRRTRESSGPSARNSISRSVTYESPIAATTPSDIDEHRAIAISSWGLPNVVPSMAVALANTAGLLNARMPGGIISVFSVFVSSIVQTFMARSSSVVA